MPSTNNTTPDTETARDSQCRKKKCLGESARRSHRVCYQLTLLTLSDGEVADGEDHGVAGEDVVAAELLLLAQ